MDDMISRQVAINEFDGVKVDEENCTEYDIGYNDGIDFAVSRLSVLPAVQPEQWWIPCNERLPEINQIVLLSTNSNNVYVGYRNKPELLWQVEEDGRKQWVYDPESYDVDIDVLPKTEDIDFYCEGVNDGGFLSITSANYNDRFEGVTAWMSLPEPYKEDKQG